MRRVPIESSRRQASVASSPWRRLTSATRFPAGAARTWTGAQSSASPRGGIAAAFAVAPAIQTFFERRRGDRRRDRPARRDERDVDAVLALAVQEVSGAVERVDEKEEVARQDRVGGLLGDGGHLRPGLGEAAQDQLLGGEIGRRRRAAVGFGPELAPLLEALQQASGLERDVAEAERDPVPGLLVEPHALPCALRPGPILGSLSRIVNARYPGASFYRLRAEPTRAALEFTVRSAFGADLMASVTLDSLDLAALLCSRVCHDVISPVGAIVNGLEVLEDENEASMREFALDLIRKSARQASARLQFARLAFGAAGSAGASIDLGDAEQVAKGMFTDDKVALSWEGPRALLPKNKVKLLLNLVVLATNAIPRGGAIAVKIAGDAAAAEFTLTAKGPNARIPAHVEGLLAGTPESGSVDAHAIQPFYTGLVAQAAGMPVTFSIEGDEVTIRAVPAA